VDYWHRLRNLSPRVTYDRASHVVAAGGLVYFSSSADDKVYCLNASTGEPRWSFFAGGPVRLAPSVFKGRVYVGSDDGWVYCLGSRDGVLIWKARAAPDSRQVIGNGRMISAWPVRTGVLVEDGTAYFGAGLFPNEGVYVWALNARDGSVRWKRKTNGLSPQGYLLASPTRLYVPTGRTSPAAFSRADGRQLGTFRGSGGTFALLTSDVLVHGPGRTGQLEVFGADRRDRFATFNGLHMVVTPRMSFLHARKELSALDRLRYFELLKKSKQLSARHKAIAKRLKQLGKSANNEEGKKLKAELMANKSALGKISKAMPGCYVWKRPCEHPYSLILAGDTLFAGGEDEVAAFSTSDGELRWRGKVTGRAYGLAAANGRLFVSTDKGAIHCFGTDHE